LGRLIIVSGFAAEFELMGIQYLFPGEMICLTRALKAGARFSAGVWEVTAVKRRHTDSCVGISTTSGDGCRVYG